MLNLADNQNGSQEQAKMVYIIEDDLDVRQGLELLLLSANIESAAFGSAEEFIETYKSAEKDLLILDLHMPGMDGCDLLRYCRQNEMNLPTIIITAYDELSSRECAKSHGAVAYLRKPIDGETLIDMIKYTLS
jgi:FixJ family two-component response regulator